MVNDELISKICHTLIDKGIYCDLKTICIVFSWLDEDVVKSVLDNLQRLEDKK